MRRHRGWIALAALALLGGCAQTVPPPAASAPPVRGRIAVPTRGFDCTTHNFYLFTTSSCGDGGFRIFSPATE